MEAARLYHQAIELADDASPYLKTYNENFSEEELRDWNLSRPPVPIWDDIGHTLAFPFRNGGWISLVIAAVFWFFAGFLPLIGGILAAAWTATLVGKHMKWAGVGNYGTPPPVNLEFDYLWQYLAASIAVFFPGVAAMIAGATMMGNHPAAVLILAGPLYFAGLLLFPMAYLTAVLFNQATMAFHYGFLVRSVLRIPGQYGLMLLALVAMVALRAFVNFAVPVAQLWIIADIVGLYFAVVYGRILGQLYYNNRKKLNWF
jgi:hypothetical protein